MTNLGFCTLTYGEKYINYGDNLIKQLNDMGHHVFVLTNDMNHYKESDILTPLKYEKEYFSFHEKRKVVQECLKYYDSALFLDADVHIESNFDFNEKITPGLHIFATFGNIGLTFCSNDITKCGNINNRNTKYGNEGIEFAKKNNLKLKKIYHKGFPEEYLEHFLEGRWLIKKDNGFENVFFEIWDLITEFTEEFDIRYGYTNTIGSGEGAAMSIAAHNSGITFNGVSPLVSTINKTFISNYQEKINGTKPWNIAG